MHSRSAFSLVELSIVLVILGLLVGGILSGRSLIRASELRAVTTEHQKYFTAVQAFKDKYFALPGDMSNASQFWGLAVVGPLCSAFSSTTPLTCDGDANGQIDGASATSLEMYRAWQHLSNAGLIEGTYNGIGGVPTSKIPTGTWLVYYTASYSGSATRFDGAYGNMFLFSQILLPEEVWNIDTKLDDGKPATGKLVVFTTPAIATCTDGASSATLTANYLLTGTGKTCGIYFRQQF